MSCPVHFIGIGGIGMSSLAHCMLDQGRQVSGSDLKQSTITQQLGARGANIHLGHAAQNVPEGALVVFSTDVPLHNVELQRAQELGCQLLHRSELLAQLCRQKQALAVAGTHGKTTTSSMLAAILVEAQLSPGYVLGGIPLSWGLHGKWDQGAHLVLEACESDGTLVRYPAHGAIVTNIDSDHLNHYGSMEALEETFRIFIEQVQQPELLFVCEEDPRLKRLGRGVAYGFGEGALVRGLRLQQLADRTVFDVHWPDGHRWEAVELALLGRHNALNAVGAIGLAVAVGVREEAVRSALRQFRGTRRRLERRGEQRGMLVLEDYGHHPTELMVTLAAVRAAYPERRLIAVFQPHRYSRTQLLWDQWGAALSGADVLLITDVYGAGEPPILGVTGDRLAQTIDKAHFVQRSEVAAAIGAVGAPGDLVLLLGAGDIGACFHELA
jgi:UDP-N-acetylmuramate--alanine ligase